MSTQEPVLSPSVRQLLVSVAQARLWYQHKIQKPEYANNQQLQVQINGALDIEILEHCFNVISERHEALRTVFEQDEEGKVIQIIQDPSPVTVIPFSVSIADKQTIEKEVTRISLEQGQEPYDLSKGPLFRVSLLQLPENRQILLFSYHDMILGHESLTLMLKEISTLYSAYSQGTSPALEKQPLQWTNYTMWEQDWLDSPEFKRRLAYCKQKLQGSAPSLNLPFDRTKTAKTNNYAKQEKFSLAKDLMSDLWHLGQKLEVWPITILLAVYKVLLMRYTGQDDILVATSSNMRPSFDSNKILGHFADTILLRSKFSGDDTFVQLLRRLETTYSKAQQEFIPYAVLEDALEAERDINAPLYQAAFIADEMDFGQSEIAGQAISHPKPQFLGSTNTDLTFRLMIINDNMEGYAEYNTDLFDAETIKRLVEHYRILLTAVIKNPNQILSTIPILKKNEQQQILRDWNDTKTDYPKNQCVHQLFEAQVIHAPNSLALVFEEQQLSYEDLNNRSNQLAHYLNAKGIGLESKVGILVERSPEMIISLLAVLKAGAAYVPIDPNYPQQRITYILQDANVQALLTQKSFVDKAATIANLPLYCLDDATLLSEIKEYPETNVSLSAQVLAPGNLAYMIYTSGSTGKPKGTLLSHEGMVNLSMAHLHLFSITKQSRIIQFAPLGYDAATWEWIMALMNGASLYVLKSEIVKSTELLTARMQQYGITHATLPTALLAHLDATQFPALSHLIVAGEACPEALARQWCQSRQFFNAYGPTEITVCASILRYTEASQGISIGRPLPNFHLYVLDAHLNPVPIGAPGELYIGGPGLARGYHNRADLSAERFIPHPYSKDPGKRLYRSGDLVRFTADGNIEFIGRIDHQVKLRGFRIELDEIIKNLLAHAAVNECTVLVREDTLGDKRLVAYVSPDHAYAQSDNNAINSAAVDTWRDFFDSTYGAPIDINTPFFDHTGWDHSHTGGPIAEADMREWADSIVAQILLLKPQRVLEIGCGTGLIVGRVLPHCEKYVATDVSVEALKRLQNKLPLLGDDAQKVTLHPGRADDLSSLAEQRFDTIIINSVVQYSPDIDYLLSVISEALRLLSPGGQIFIGDVRHLGLLETFHSAVQLYKSLDDTQPVTEFKALVQSKALNDSELFVAPMFFEACKTWFPTITHVQVIPKLGTNKSELADYRYNVILHTATDLNLIKDILWQPWEREKLDANAIRTRLQERQPHTFALVNIPNARIARAVQTHQLCHIADESITSIVDLKTKLDSCIVEGLFAYELSALAGEIGYVAEFSWARDQNEGAFDVVFHQQGNARTADRLILFPNIEWEGSKASLRKLANNPQLHNLKRALLPVLKAHLLEFLPEYMLPSMFIFLDSLPLNANGKIDQKALPVPDAAMVNTGEYVAPKTPLERQLIGIWAGILNLPKEKIGIRDNFFELGGHSLFATRVVSAIRWQLKAEIQIQDLFYSNTIETLAPVVNDAIGQSSGDVNILPLKPIERSGDLQLSFAQQRLWFLNQLAGKTDTRYNEPLAMRLEGELDVAALQAAFQEIVNRHESLRTTFESVDGEPIQIISDELKVNMSLTGCTEAEVSDYVTQNAAHVFNLSEAPLIKITLLRLSEKEHVLLINIHHIISDGWTLEVLHRELAVLYSAYSKGDVSPLPPLPIQYADFAHWQRQWLQGEVLAEQLHYWKAQLKDAAPLLELPTDRPRPATQGYQGSIETFVIPGSLIDRLNMFAKKERATPFMVLIAAFKVLLFRYSGQQDISIGTPIANRRRSEIEGLVGFFVNTLVLRSQLDSKASFKTYLQQIKTHALAAYSHQDIPFELLVEALNPTRSMSYTPLFQVMFALQNASETALILPNINVTSINSDTHTAKFDITISLTESGEGIEGVLEYNTDLFDRSTIVGLINHYQVLLEGVVSNPAQRLSELPLLSKAEQQQILFDWNHTEAEYPKDRCIHQLFEEQVERTPNAIAVVYEDQTLSYQELDDRSNQLAHYLIEQDVEADVRVGLCLERSLEMIIGILGILKAGGAYVPVDPGYPQQRIEYLFTNSNISILLTQERLLDLIPGKERLTCLCLDKDWPRIAEYIDINPVMPVEPSNLAYVIYTSGSTGQPKGTLLNHEGLVNLSLTQRDLFSVTEKSCVIQFASLSFDAATWEWVMALTNGAQLCLIKADVAKSSEDLTAWMRHYQVTHATLPSALLPQLDAAQFLYLTYLIVAGEACSEDLAQQWCRGRKFFNAYGPTEATVCASIYRYEGQGLNIGRPLSNVHLYILDEYLNPVPIGVPGELYISSAGLARGYYSRSDLTAENFIPDPFSGVLGERLYRSGDLTCYLPNGNIKFLSRIDFQVKIRGFRIELGEIENALSSQPGVREAIVMAHTRKANGEKYLVAYITSSDRQTPTQASLRSELQKLIPEHTIPAFFVFLDEFPLTPNSKVDRKALPEPDTSALQTQEYIAPSTETEKTLTDFWSVVLNISSDNIGIHDNFFELGGHSLLITRVASQIIKTLNVEIPIKDLFTATTIQALALEVDKAITHNPLTNDKAFPLQAIERNGPQPLSYAQQRLWFIDQFEGKANTQYNIPWPLRLKGRLNVAAVEKAFKTIIQRHESLRTTFQSTGGEAVQIIADKVELNFPIINVTEEEVAAYISSCAMHVFDLSTGPLIKVTLLRLSDDEYVLLINIHHIIADGWSMGVLSRELAACYAAYKQGQTPELDPLPIQYADFAHWQKQWLEGERLAPQIDYWKTQLQDVPALLELPTDRPRPATQSHRGKVETFIIPKTLTNSLNRLSQEENATLFMVLMATFKVLLTRYSGKNDICVGTPIANRRRVELEGLIGFFMNTLVMRNQVELQSTFKDFLRQVKTTALAAYDNQDIPFEQLVEILEPERSMAYSPLFQVMFTLQNIAEMTVTLPHITATAIEFETHTSKFDLFMHIGESDDNLTVSIEYNVDIFDRATIKRMGFHYKLLLEEIVKTPDQSIAALPILSEAEQQLILYDWNATGIANAQQCCIHELFEEQANKTPNLPAVMFAGQTLSYAELNRSSNQLAHHLIAQGVGPDVRVGLCVERSFNMVIAILGILKAGGAYVPLDPNYPKERLEYMLTQADANILLTQHTLINHRPTTVNKVICLDTNPDWQTDNKAANKNPDSHVHSGNLAYVIFTSGSTGKPKGVSMPHQALTNLIQWQLENSVSTIGSRTLQFSSFSFDVSFQELFSTWCNGGELVLIPEEMQRDPFALWRFLDEVNINRLFMPFIALQQLAEAAATDKQSTPLALQEIITAGEQLLITPVIRELFQNLKGCRLHNHYGPAESHVATALGLDDQPNAWPMLPTIGKLIANDSIYILDEYMQAVPIGVFGEIHIGGIGLARCYLGRPDLSAERFIPDPFGNQTGTHLYKTGDLARYRLDGNIEFIGRADQQVKIRGFRIEPGEVENMLAEQPGIREAVVMAHRRDQQSQDKYLVAYLVQENDSERDQKDLQQAMQKVLPDYMVPSAWIFLKELPLTASGKLDRKALPIPDVEALQTQAYTPANTDTERQLVEIWAEILKHPADKIGTHDNFFNLGGHSLLITRVASQIRKIFKVEIQIKDLFTASTVEMQALLLDEKIKKESLIKGLMHETNTIDGNDMEEIRL